MQPLEFLTYLSIKNQTISPKFDFKIMLSFCRDLSCHRFHLNEIVHYFSI